MSFSPLIRCSLRSRLVGAVNREKESRFGSVPFLADVGINSVCLFHSHPFCRQRACALFLHHCIAHFPVCLRGALCPKMSAATPPLPKSVVLARGAASTVTLLSVRTSEFLLCSFYALARFVSLLWPVPSHTPVHVHRPACFVLPLLEVCTFPIYL